LGHTLLSSGTLEDVRDHVSLRASTPCSLGVLRVCVGLNPRAAKLFFVITRLVPRPRLRNHWAYLYHFKKRGFGHFYQNLSLGARIRTRFQGIFTDIDWVMILHLVFVISH